jgi:cation diffusion facilitator family transporter
MHDRELHRWQHLHVFGQDVRRRGETAVHWVIAITFVMMAIEVAAGLAFSSMALLADGIHMASHAAALAIAAAAYALARRLAGDARFTFGSGKFNALGGFAGGLLLAVFAIAIAAESVQRLAVPLPIAFDQAIAVAILGLIVNAGCAMLLGRQRGHTHDHPHPPAAAAATASHHHADLNLRSAYLHVVADALTSVLAIAALLAGKYLDAVWVDPVVGVLGALLVGRWCWDLLSRTAAVLLDRQEDDAVGQAVIAAIEADGDARVADMHIWSIGPDIRAAALSVIAHAPKTPDAYRAALPPSAGIVHATIEVHACPAEHLTSRHRG